MGIDQNAAKWLYIAPVMHNCTSHMCVICNCIAMYIKSLITHVISKMIVFALVFGFLKMNGHIVNVFEESKLSNDPSNTKQLGNICTY